MSRGTIIGIVVALALIGGGAWFFLQNEGAEEVMELVAEGGERQLREPMRPAADGPNVVIFALDGVGANDLLSAVRDGRMPTVAALLGAAEDSATFAHGYAVPGVLSILPSTTLAAWSSIFTGQTAAFTGSPGNEWFDRATATYFAPAPVSVSGIDDAMEVYTESLFSKVIAVPTLYEQADVRSYVSLMHVHRGADLLTMPDLGGFDELMTGFFEGVTQESEVKQGIYQELDDLSVDGAIQAIQKFGLPDLQTVYLPGIDLYTHVAEGPIEAQQRYLTEVTDPEIARLVDVYRQLGALESTYFVFVADHGHTPVLNDDRHSLDVDGPSEPPTVLQEAGFRLRPFQLDLDDDQRDFQATVAYQGAFGYVYLADRSSCPNDGDVCDWRRGPRWEEDVVPVLRAFTAANESGAGAPGLQGAIDLIFSRQPTPAGEDSAPFQVWDGERLVDVDAYLAANPRPELLDFAERLDGLGAGPYGNRAGDILLMAKSGRERDIAERFYFSHTYRSWHGSATAEDSLVPLVVANPGGSGGDLRGRLQGVVGDHPSQLDIVPVVLNLLGKGVN